MKLSLILITIIASLSAHAKVFSTGMQQPILLPNGRNGSTSIAQYKNVNSVAFKLEVSSAVLIFSTADLYLTSCSATGIADRCPLGETTTGNQQLVIVDNATNTTVYSEIFKYGLSSGVIFPSTTTSNDKLSAKAGANITSTLHGVSRVLPAGNYTAYLQVRNDFNPMTVHPKRLTILVVE